jgi:hypothetical protein
VIVIVQQYIRLLLYSQTVPKVRILFRINLLVDYLIMIVHLACSFLQKGLQRWREYEMPECRVIVEHDLRGQ